MVGNQFRRRALPAGQQFPAFPGNQIPAGMLDPVSQEVLRHLPVPGASCQVPGAVLRA